MPEIILLILSSIFFMPPLITALFARSLGRRFWVWFIIGCILPFISVFVLAFMPVKDIKNDTELK